MTQEEFDKYIRQGEPGKKEKSYAWQTAIGLQAVDGLKPSAYLIEAAKQDIEGEISIDEVERLVKSYYQSKTHRTDEDEREQEADLAATNIRRILAEKTLSFSVVGLTSIHRRIFNGIFSFAGEIRNYNITKQEWVLRGDTVLYVSATDIRQAVEHDLEQEKQFDYSHITKDKLIQHLTKFIADLWQIHPFGEGNTRTMAVFTILYLRSLGFNVENNLFARHSWYFRNALVRANYQNIEKGIVKDSTFLEKFFRNLLLGETNELRNRYMLVATPDDSMFSADNRTSYRTSSADKFSERNAEEIDDSPCRRASFSAAGHGSGRTEASRHIHQQLYCTGFARELHPVALSRQSQPSPTEIQTHLERLCHAE